jgi:hypothetical protein
MDIKLVVAIIGMGCIAIGMAAGYYLGVWRGKLYFKAAEETLEYCNSLINLDRDR